MNRAALIAAAVLALSACAKSEEASLVPPQEEGYNMVDPVGAPLAADEVALGEWAAASQEEQPALQFGPAGAGPVLSMRCGEEDAVVLQRHGVLAGPGLNSMAVEAGGTVQRLPAEAVPGPIPLLRASLPAGNGLIRQLGQAQGRITVRAGEGEPLIVPASPMIAAFVRGCAAGSQNQAAANEPGNTAATANSNAPVAAPANTATGNVATPRPSERTPR